MLIQITITIPPSGIAGPFDLFSDADGYVSPFETQVPATELESGYVVELPLGATIIRVCSVGDCENCIDIPTNCPTTTTTSSSSTTTTSTSSTSTTTSTSSTTTTTTTEAPPYKFNWRLQTQTPSTIGTVNLEITVDGISVVDSTISVGNTLQSGQLLIQAGAIVQATMTNEKVGSWHFGNKIVKNGNLYQPNDICNPCVDELITPLFQSYVMEPFAQDFIFDGVIIIPTTTTTTTTSSSSTSTTTSTTTIPPTTTTTTTCDCSLNGLSAVFVVPPTTTTTTSSNPSVDPGGISSQTNPSAADCFLAIDSICYIQHQSVGTINVGDRIFNNPGATSPFNGNGNYYKIRLNSNSTEYSAKVDSNGYVLSPVSICF